MPKVKEIYYTETEICNILDLKLFERNSRTAKNDKIYFSYRFFAYSTIESRVKLIFDILKQPEQRATNQLKLCDKCKNKCNACFTDNGINNWTGIYISDINKSILNSTDEYYNLQFNPRSQTDMTFLSRDKIINMYLPCLDIQLVKANRSPVNDQNIIDRITEPIIKSIENIEIDFYKYNPKWKSTKKPLLIVSGSKIIIWDLTNRDKEYLSIDLNSQQEFNHLRLVIIDADWNLDGKYLVVTSKSTNIENFYISLIFDIKLNYIALIEEQRSQKVLILKTTEKNNFSRFCLFTIGKKLKLDEQNRKTYDSKFGMYEVKKTNQVNIYLIEKNIFFNFFIILGIVC